MVRRSLTIAETTGLTPSLKVIKLPVMSPHMEDEIIKNTVIVRPGASVPLDGLTLPIIPVPAPALMVIVAFQSIFRALE
jgi:hypothetical protein